MIINFFLDVINTIVDTALSILPVVSTTLSTSVQNAISWLNSAMSIWSNVIPIGITIAIVLSQVVIEGSILGYKAISKLINLVRGSG